MLRGGTWIPGWSGAAALIASAKVVAALGLAVAAAAMPDVPVTGRRALMLALTVAFAASGAVLFAGTRRDRRAELLGLALLLEASAFADRLLDPFATRDGVVFVALRALFSLRVDAFAPFYLWEFVREFPRVVTFGAMRSFTRAMVAAALVTGVGLFSINVVASLLRLNTATRFVADILTVFGRDHGTQLYWVLIFTLVLAALATLPVRARTAGSTERRRAALLVAGLVASSTPPVLWAMLTAVWPAFARALPVSRAGWVVYPALLTAPMWAAYAVLVRHALDVRLVIRRAVRYALQRQTVVILALLPFALLAVQLWRNRSLSVGTLVMTWDGAVIGALACLGIAGLRGGRVVLDRIDRRFFREQYDARLILGKLVEQCRAATSRRELADVLGREVDRALHVDTVHLLLLEASAGLFVSAGAPVRPLAQSSQLVALAADRGGPIDAQPDSSNPVVTRLPAGEQAWLLDHAARLLVPLLDVGHRVVGLIVLGEKKSELPYSAEDRMLLTTVASAAALSLAHVSTDPVLRPSDTPSEPVRAHGEPARECTACGFLQPADTEACLRCHGSTEHASVPLVVAGKFRILERIGRGAMGVAYRALDLNLDRPVAIKTLPRVQPDEAWRLRREARVVAAVSHPNLALIYGSESWQGTPMLVLEYLSGGTLDDRLTRGPMTCGDTVLLGITLAEVITAIHRAGILHRDIKPSNIGFTSDGTAKLLDFGIARLISSSQREDTGEYDLRVRTRAAMASASDHRQLSSTEDGQLVGTPLYMSPEAVDGQPPEPAFDVWSICVSLYEAIAGASPFQGGSVPAVLRRISACNAPDLRLFVPDAPAPLADFFRDAFSPDRHIRPVSGVSLRERLVMLGPAVARSRLRLKG